jgi:hypothetical protein
MADEELELEEREDLGEEFVFAEALSNAQVENYLGDQSTITSLVRKAIDDLTEKFQHIDDKDNAEKIRVMKMLAQRNGVVLLGKSPLFKPLPGWNEPGRIDVFLAHWMGSAETDSDKRMEHVFVILFNRILEIAAYAGVPGVLPEQWQFQVDAVIHEFVNLCLGIDLPTQALMEAQ